MGTGGPDAVAELEIRLLGRPQLRQGAKVVPFVANQRDQLLCYLAYHRDWVGREGLQGLFWAEQPSAKAQRNLRRVLARVKKLTWVKGVEASRHALRWRVDTDLGLFQSAFGAGRWEEALGHYGGSLLEALEGNSLNGFSRWLELERERCRQDWRMAVLKRADALGLAGRASDAAFLLKPLLAHEDLDDEVLTAYMQAAYRAGGRDQALSAYEAFAARLYKELALSPTAELEGLARAMREGDESLLPASSTARLLSEPAPEPAPPPSRSPPATLPTQTGSFVGRDAELAEVVKLLAKPECRLLTLTGLGGSGKTRMALKVAEGVAPSFPDGVFFVGLAALGSPTLIPATIAERLQLIRGQADAVEQVVTFIGDKRLLLILDNYEHLLAGATLTESLIKGCPNLKLLVTSRERLNVEAEWLLAVGGLRYPQGEFDPEEALQWDAPHLFLQRAKRVKPDFEVGRDELAHLLTICRHLEGSPLGLELAAVWARLMPLKEIADEIARGIDFLDSSSRSKAERHQSLRAVFDHSWRLLTPREQEALGKLSVFAGGFSREAAKQVAGISLPVLAALVDKSLLRVSSDGRYSRHMLVYQYSREKLARKPEEQAQAEEEHGGYFMQFLADQRDALRGPNSKVAFEALDKDLENIRAAWRWALRQEQAERIERATFPLSNYLARRARFGEAFGVFSQAAAVLTDSDPVQRRALGGVLTEGGWHAYQLGHYPEGKRLAERGLALAKAANDSTTAMLALNALGCLFHKTGDYERARAYHQQAVSFPESQQRPTLQANLLNNAAIVERSLGRYAEARAYAQQSLTFYELSGNHVDLLNYPLRLGEISLYQNRLSEAQGYFTKGLAQARALGVQSRTSDFLVLLARTLYELGSFGEAQEHCQEALGMMRANGGRSRDVSALKNTLGRLAAAQRDEAAAYDLFRESLSTAWSSGELPKVLETLVYLAELWLKEERAVRAAEVLSLAQHHPSSEHWLKERARKLLENLSLEDPTQAQARGKALSLSEFIPSLLAEWPRFPNSSIGSEQSGR